MDKALTLGRSSQELAWVKCKDLEKQALELAKEVFEEERVLEDECYDSRLQSQGREVIILKRWEDAAAGLFSGSRGPSSDGYYSWFVEHEMGLENGLCHICDCEASRCKVRKQRGDNRELIHIDGLLTPAAMVGTGYLRGMGVQLGESALAAAARDKKAQSPRLGSGLDALLAEQVQEENPPAPKRKSQQCEEISKPLEAGIHGRVSQAAGGQAEEG